MSKTPITLARELLGGDVGKLELLRIHEFADDSSAHDDELTERLYADFSAEYERVQTDLTKQYGSPSRTGQTHDALIPLNGVFRFAVWPVADRQVFVAAAHEDRGVPILLVLGTVALVRV